VIQCCNSQARSTAALCTFPGEHLPKTLFLYLQLDGCKATIEEGVKLLGGRLDALVNNAGKSPTPDLSMLLQTRRMTYKPLVHKYLIFLQQGERTIRWCCV
jgi:NAD(P)-dependent dehydrogenase (short-subunit alcohol dehydrogenase family)